MVVEWISVKDKLPDEDVEVIVFCPMGNTYVPFQGYAIRNENDWYTDEGRLISTPEPISHWMPKLEEPK